MGLFRNGRFFAIHTDHLGTPRLMMNDVNKPVWQWPYSAFGTTKPTGILQATPKPKEAMTNQPVLLKATGAAQALALRHPGQMNDAETGTLQNNWRSYWAMHGRYTQVDPIGQRGGLNVYGYANQNPLNYFDPDGKQAQAIPIIVPIVLVGCALSPGCRDLAKDLMYSKPPRVNDPEANREWQDYKDQYAEPPPPNLDKCEKLKWQLKREQALLAARQAWDAKWGPHHTDAIAQSQRAIKNFEQKLKDAGCSCP